MLLLELALSVSLDTHTIAVGSTHESTFLGSFLGTCSLAVISPLQRRGPLALIEGLKGTPPDSPTKLKENQGHKGHGPTSAVWA